MNLGSLLSAHASKFLANPPLPNSSLGLATVSTTFVETVDLGGVGVTYEAGLSVAVGLLAVATVYVDVGIGTDEGTVWIP